MLIDSSLTSATHFLVLAVNDDRKFPIFKSIKTPYSSNYFTSAGLFFVLYFWGFSSVFYIYVYLLNTLNTLKNKTYEYLNWEEGTLHWWHIEYHQHQQLQLHQKQQNRFSSCLKAPLAKKSMTAGKGIIWKLFSFQFVKLYHYSSPNYMQNKIKQVKRSKDQRSFGIWALRGQRSIQSKMLHNNCCITSDL